MNDLQKDQAIFKAMNEIANEVFNNACAYDEKLREMVSENGGIVCLKDILASKTMYRSMIADACCHNFDASIPHSTDNDRVNVVNIDTFSCTFRNSDVFWFLNEFKALANVKGEIFFSYEEKIDLPLITTITVTLDGASSAKKLCNFCDSNDLRPILSGVMAEVNLDTETVSFVATNGASLSVITTNNATLYRNNPNDKVLSAIFDKKDWGRICEYARKNNNEIVMEFYYHNDNQINDTAVAILGNTKIKSILQDSCKFPNWHRVLPRYNDSQKLTLTDEATNQLANFIKNKDVIHYIVSAYEGCKYLYVEYTNYDLSKHRVSKFELETPAAADIYFGASEKEFRKFSVKTFEVSDYNHAIIVGSNDFDYSIMMPVLLEGTPISAETADERRGYKLSEKYEKNEAVVAA